MQELNVDPARWLDELEVHVNWLLDPKSPLQQEQRLDELLSLSKRFLEMSRKFLALGKSASAAAQTMLSSEVGQTFLSDESGKSAMSDEPGKSDRNV